MPYLNFFLVSYFKAGNTVFGIYLKHTTGEIYLKMNNEEQATGIQISKLF